MVLLEKLFVDPWFIIKSFEVSGGYKFYKVLKTLFVSRQKNEVIGSFVVLACRP